MVYQLFIYPLCYFTVQIWLILFFFLLAIFTQHGLKFNLPQLHVCSGAGRHHLQWKHHTNVTGPCGIPSHLRK